MQISRLLEIVYILYDQKKVTAKELAKHFEVSPRTIYRDIDALNAAGIPIYTTKGNGGGISLLENFVINKSILSEKEQTDILSSLQSMKALNATEVEPVLHKLGILFNRKNTNWIEVDFSRWGSNSDEKEKFNDLKTAILDRKRVKFDYYSSYGEKTIRTIEPLKLLFKGQDWYIYGYCTKKCDYRIFKISRIRNLVLFQETFERSIPEEIWNHSLNKEQNQVELILKIDKRMAYRVYDEFQHECITKDSDGSYVVTVTFPDDEWLYGYILSYGYFIEVLEPKHVREIIKSDLEKSLKKYL